MNIFKESIKERVQLLTETVNGKSEAPFFSAGDIERMSPSKIADQVRKTGIKYLMDDFEFSSIMTRNNYDNESFYRNARRRVKRRSDGKVYINIDSDWVTSALNEDGIMEKWQVSIYGMNKTEMIFKIIWSAFNDIG